MSESDGGIGRSREESERESSDSSDDDGLQDVFQSLPMVKKTPPCMVKKCRFKELKARDKHLPLPPPRKYKSMKPASPLSRYSENTPPSSSTKLVRSTIPHSENTPLSSKSLVSPLRHNSGNTPNRYTYRLTQKSSGTAPLPAQSSEHSQAPASLVTPTSPGNSQTHISQDKTIITAIEDVASLLHTLIKRVEDNSKDIKLLKLSISESSSGSSSSDYTKKRKVLPIVRRETRKIYAMLCDENEDFGFLTGPDVSFATEENASVASRVIKEVKGQNPEFQTCDIRESIYTYYKSLCQDKSAERRGLKGKRQKSRKLRERLTRKLQDRKITLERSSLSAEDKRRWGEVMVNDMMSSEDDASGDDCIIVRPLLWRSSAANDFFNALDDQAREQKSSQALRQMKKRVVGPASERPRSNNPKIPKWAFTANGTIV